jgi:hypothetical protein
VHQAVAIPGLTCEPTQEPFIIVGLSSGVEPEPVAVPWRVVYRSKDGGDPIVGLSGTSDTRVAQQLVDDLNAKARKGTFELVISLQRGANKGVD